MALHEVDKSIYTLSLVISATVTQGRWHSITSKNNL